MMTINRNEQHRSTGEPANSSLARRLRQVACATVGSLCLAPLIIAFPATAFSPYENYLRSGRETHVGLLAELKPERQSDFETAVRQCRSKPLARQLQRRGIRDTQAFTRQIEGKHYAVIYFTYAGGLDYLGAAAAFEEGTGSIGWRGFTSPHPRAKTYDAHWLQMEWINFIRGLDVDRDPTRTLMIATTVIPEKEREYRTLHQTVWPGVVDQVVRGNIRNLSVFLVELDDQLVEFLYLEYLGNDQEADDAANQADPINQRWWKLTDACQKPFSDVTEGPWTPMNPVR
jgi:L-rhamnose mutarotase